jgi:hypothetical protein
VFTQHSVVIGNNDMKQYSTFNLDNAQMIYSWRTIFMLLSLVKVDPFLSEIQFPLQTKPEKLTEIAKWFLEEFYGTILWNADQMSMPASELFAITEKRLLLSIGRENTSAFCEWGNNLPLENTVTEGAHQLWHYIILPNYHKDKLKNILGEKLAEKEKIIQQSVAIIYDELIQVDKRIDLLEQSPSDEWEKHVVYLYNRGEEGNKVAIP